MGATTAGTLMLNPDQNSIFRGFWWSPAPGDTVGHVDFNRAMRRAKKSLVIFMYHLTHQPTIELLKALRAAGVVITIILDKRSLTRDKNKQAAEDMQKAGITIVESSLAFTIMHGKTCIIDYGTPDAMVAVTTENLTGGAWTYTRDMGVLITDPTVIEDLHTLFQTDIQNASNGGAVTPAFQSDIIAVSPANSLAKLLDFVNGAKKNLVFYTENLGDEQLMQALMDAAARGVTVLGMVPDCTEAGTEEQATRNWPFIEQLMKGGVQMRVVRLPAGTDENSPDLPYFHVKAAARDIDPTVFSALLLGHVLPARIVSRVVQSRVFHKAVHGFVKAAHAVRKALPFVDTLVAWFYIGSENSSFNSLEKAREIGVVAQDPWVAMQIVTRFLADWKVAIPATSPPTKCPLIGN
jgi:phosphatidylserine/phosphatidylglycerophosphate/cardiolipin synthase-like enzyme